MKENGVEEPVFVNATVSHPSCYVDEQGVSHTGPLVVCNVRIADMDEEGQKAAILCLKRQQIDVINE